MTWRDSYFVAGNNNEFAQRDLIIIQSTVKMISRQCKTRAISNGGFCAETRSVVRIYAEVHDRSQKGEDCMYTRMVVHRTHYRDTKRESCDRSDDLRSPLSRTSGADTRLRFLGVARGCARKKKREAGGTSRPSRSPERRAWKERAWFP